MIEILKKQWFVVLVAVIFIGFAVYCAYDTNKDKLSGKSKDGKDVVATMKDYTFTADDAYKNLYDDYSGIRALYNKFQIIVIDKAIKTTDALKTRADEIEKNMIAQAQSDAQSENNNYGTTDYKEILKKQLSYYNFDEDQIGDYCLVAAKNEEMANTYFDKNLDALFAPIFKEKSSRTVSHILIKVEDVDKVTDEEQKKMDAVDKALKDGKSFAEVAKEYSDDTGSAENGGYLGYMDTDTQYVESFVKQAVKLKTGEVSGWVKESNDNYKGFHMIMVNQADKDALEKDEDIRDDIYTAIRSANSKIDFKYIWEAAQKLDIKYASDDIKKQLLDYMEVKE